MKKAKQVLGIAISLVFALGVRSQNVGIGTPTPNTSAILDIRSTNKGLLIPQVSLTNLADVTTIPTPATGLLIYNTNAALTGGVGYYYNSGSSTSASWLRLQTAAGAGWALTGNGGTNPTVNFLGTIDAQPITFRVNNGYAGTIGATGLVAIGRGAVGAQRTAAPGVIAIGDSALFNNNNDSSEIAIGNSALFNQNTPGIGDNVAIGNFTLFLNTLGAMNTAVGSLSLALVDDSSNTALGFASLFNSGGFQNTAVGAEAMANDQFGLFNTAVGFQALTSNTNGFSNVAVGHVSLLNNTSGNRNTATGRAALANDSSGLRNTANGYFSLVSNLSGSRNVALGAYAGRSTSTGNDNIFIGDSAMAAFGPTTNSIAIGTGTVVNSDNTVIIGNASTTSIGGPTNWSVMSDGRYKKAVAENVSGLDFIMKLRPVTYQYDYPKIKNQLYGKSSNRDEPLRIRRDLTINRSLPTGISESVGALASRRKITEAGDYSLNTGINYREAVANPNESIRFSGFIAQEVEEAAKQSGYDFSGIDKPKNKNSNYALRYAEFVVPLVKAIQEQQVIIDSLTKRLEILEKKQYP